MNRLWSILAGVIAWVSFQPMAMAIDSIEVDANGDYIIRYESYLGPQEVKFIPATKINPVVTGYVTEIKYRTSPVPIYRGKFRYSYKILNGADSRQLLDGVNLMAQKVTTEPMFPVGWIGTKSQHRYAGTEYIVGWSHMKGDSWEKGLAPGATLDGFFFNSDALPGVGRIDLSGATPSGMSLHDEGPDVNSPISRQFDQIIDNDFVTRLGPVPLFELPGKATTLASIQKHLDTDIVAFQIVDPVFVGQMDRWFISGIDAASRGNTKGVIYAIDQLINLLKEQYPDIGKAGNELVTDDQLIAPKLIAKLAARVLYFDLQYIKAQLEYEPVRVPL